ncbi:hypothetical protein [Roseibium sp. Sym1]|uniref:hypothetical protein n=1 Tax=Roseibium sp. Sym1 TaxID=3016006 RepID=UPI0022B3942F|nr:hypothetical protein [Roseibium sp. Sym1]
MQNKIRRALKNHIKANKITVSAWCRRANVPSRTVYSFLDGTTNDLGASKLVALADAEQIGIDQLINRITFDRTEVLELAGPIVERLGSLVTLEEVARCTGVTLPSLQTEWVTPNDLIIDVYLRTVPVLAIENLSKVQGQTVRERFASSTTLALEWVSTHRDFYLAAQTAILNASRKRRSNFQRANEEVIKKIADEILDGSADLLIVDKAQKLMMARIYLLVFRHFAMSYAHTLDLSETTVKIDDVISFMLYARVAK